MQTVKVFLASSAELKEDRIAFEIEINRRNNDWVDRGVHLKLVVWEDFLDAMSKTRLQDEYNQEISGCDIFVMLFFTKVGLYTEEEFETALHQFKSTGKPFIFTYFKDAAIRTGGSDRKALTSLWAFQDKLKALGHFYTVYENTDALTLHFYRQLDKLAASDFIDFDAQDKDSGVPGAVTYRAEVHGDGANAQGAGAKAVGRGGVLVDGNNSGFINTGTQTITDTGGGAYVGGSVTIKRGNFIGRDSIATGVSAHDLESLFASLAAAVAAQAPAGVRTDAVRQVEQLKAEVGKEKQSDDSRIARMVEGLVGLVPGAVGAVVSTFATPILGGIAGPVTKYVLGKLKSE